MNNLKNGIKSNIYKGITYKGFYLQMIKLYKNDLSPPARAAMMVTELIKVPVQLIDVDLMKAEQRNPDFLKVFVAMILNKYIMNNCQQ